MNSIELANQNRPGGPGTGYDLVYGANGQLTSGKFSYPDAIITYILNPDGTVSANSTPSTRPIPPQPNPQPMPYPTNIAPSQPAPQPMPYPVPQQPSVSPMPPQPNPQTSVSPMPPQPPPTVNPMPAWEPVFNLIPVQKKVPLESK